MSIKIWVARNRSGSVSHDTVACIARGGSDHPAVLDHQPFDGRARDYLAAVLFQNGGERLVHRPPASAEVADVVLGEEGALEVAQDEPRAQLARRTGVGVQGGDGEDEAS